MNDNRPTRLVRLTLPLAVLIVVFSSCAGDRVLRERVLSLSREVVACLPMPESDSLLTRIDSLERAACPDTTLARLGVDIATRLKQNQADQQLFHYVQQVQEALGSHAGDDRKVQHAIIAMNLQLSDSYINLGLMDRAMQTLIKQQIVTRRCGFTDLEVELLSQIAYIYNERRQWNEAIAVSENMARLCQQDSTQAKNLAYSYNNIAWSHFGKGDLDKAIEWGMLALHSVEPGDTLLAMRTHANIGTFYNHKRQYALGREHLERASRYYERTGNQGELAVALPKLALSMLRLGQPDSARVLLDEAMATLPVCDYGRQINVLSFYIRFCRTTGDMATENTLLRKLCQVSDSVIRGGNNGMLMQIYEDEVKRSDMTLAAFNRSQNRLLGVIGALAVALVAVGGLWWRHRRDRADTIEALATKADGWHSMLLEASIDLEHSKELAKELNQGLSQLQRDVLTVPRKDLQQTVRSLNALLQRQESDRSNDLLALAHAEFFDRLLALCPQLTNNDLRVCALLRRGMTSKEIAAILCRDPHSIDVTRMRIRRKLELKPEDDLFLVLRDLA